MRTVGARKAYRFVARNAAGDVLFQRQSDGELTGSNIGAVVRGLLGGATGFAPAASVTIEAVRPEQPEQQAQAS